MNVKYFKDTDAALLVFSQRSVAEAREISEDIYVDLDEKGNLASMTIEHAKENASLPEVDVQEMSSDAP